MNWCLCAAFRIHTNIDLTKVRFNSIQYNIRDLESKIYVPERNQLIVDTWLQYVKDKRTVIFCASVRHAKEIAGRLHDAGVLPKRYLARSKRPTGGKFWPALKRDKQRFCVPVTCSRGLGLPGHRGALHGPSHHVQGALHPAAGPRYAAVRPAKKGLMVFDFVDNASQYNMPYSMHRLFRLKEYRPGALVLEQTQKIE